MDEETLVAMKHSELQALAKKYNIKANQKGEQIIEQLLPKLQQSESLRPVRTSSRLSSAYPAAVQPVSKPTRTASRRVSTLSTSKANPQTYGSRSRKASAARPRAGRASVVVEDVEEPVGIEERDEHENDQEEEEEVEVQEMPPPPRPTAKDRAKKTQERLGVGRPVAAGGSGPRKSTAKSKPPTTPGPASVIRDVLVPSLRFLKEEARERRATSSSVVPAASSKQSQQSPLITNVGLSSLDNLALTTMLRTLEDRVDKNDSVLAEARHKIATLEDQNTQLLPLLVEVEVLRREVAELKAASGLGEDGAASGDKVPPSEGKQKMAEPIEIGSPRHAARQTPSRRVASTTLINSVPPIQPATPRSDDVTNGEQQLGLSPFPPTPASEILNNPPSPQSRTGHESSSRHASPRPARHTSAQPAQPFMKTAISRARALSNQPATSGQPMAFNFNFNDGATVAPPRSNGDDGGEKLRHLGKHGRDDKRGNSVPADRISASPPKKKQRLAHDIADGEMGANVNLAVGTEQREEATQAQGTEQRQVITSLANTEAEVATKPTSTTRRSAPRASSQPPREQSNRKPSRGKTHATPGPQRKARAGSADVPGPSSASRKPPSGRFTHTFSVIANDERRTMSPPVSGGVNGDAAYFSIPGPSAVATMPVARPAPISEESEEIEGEPPLLKPLTHFDSGIEFYGPVSKQGYKSDWHEGVVLDDPIDAETLRRGQALMAEEAIGGRFANPPPPATAAEIEMDAQLHSGVPLGPQLSTISEDDEMVMGSLLGHVNFPMLHHHPGF
ncbi:hypothetical protein FRB94_010298 [Tulasnella sp. JGI-2019a]|nr:hypothetical protein FRB93_009275 [Tulasnella sp. JGI-2019a]KAG8993891.1 hypothetical protein FRB94_010298 [Tulasnella sp. JGI-2019a]KAG9027240.1 hypothetical protein FRB95_007957 [Tulasnella sp. JGI-2019a]